MAGLALLLPVGCSDHFPTDTVFQLQFVRRRAQQCSQVSPIQVINQMNLSAWRCLQQQLLGIFAIVRREFSMSLSRRTQVKFMMAI